MFQIKAQFLIFSLNDGNCTFLNLAELVSIGPRDNGRNDTTVIISESLKRPCIFPLLARKSSHGSHHSPPCNYYHNQACIL